MGILSWLTNKKPKEVEDIAEEVAVVDIEAIKELLLKDAKLSKMHNLQSEDVS